MVARRVEISSLRQVYAMAKVRVAEIEMRNWDAERGLDHQTRSTMLP